MIRKISTLMLMILVAFNLVVFTSEQPSVSACTVYLGKKLRFDMEVSPKIALFHPDKDGYLYPGCPKITKYLKVVNVGDLPFRICMLNATFYGDVYLATGLQIEILELGKGKGEKPNLLYNGSLSKLGEGVRVYGEKLILPKDSITLQISVWMPPTAGNEYQGLTLRADISITVCLASPRYRGSDRF